MVNPFRMKIVTDPLPGRTLDELCRVAESGLVGLPGRRIHSLDEVKNLNFPHSRPGEEIACSKELGEAALVLLSRTLDHEVAWLYSNGVWRVAGIGKKSSIEERLDSYQNFTSDYAGKPYARYHLHPPDVVKRIISLGKIKVTLSHAMVQPNGPSPEDFGALAIVGGALDNFGIPRPSSLRVADNFGIWEYGMDRKMESKVPRAIIVGKKQKEMFLPHYLKQLGKLTACPEQYVRQLLGTASKEGIQLSYTPIFLR